MPWRVLITASGIRRAGEQAQELLRRGGCELIFPPKFGPLASPVLMPLLAEADAVLASLDDYSAATLASRSAGRLKIIARWGVGYDSIDLPTATRQGMVVTYTPGLLDDAVADYTFALLLALARRVHEGHLGMRGNRWEPAWGTDVAGKTLGIVGCGRIGLAVARRASGFNLRLLAYSPRPKPEAASLGIQSVSLDELLAESDFISLHAALTPQSRGMIGQAQFQQIKPGALLINTARGALIDEPALAHALVEGRLAGAALDVFATEPLPADSPLRSAPNVLLSPHQASFARQTGERASLMAAQAIIDLMQGRVPQNVLNPQVFDSPNLRAGLSLSTR